MIISNLNVVINGCNNENISLHSVTKLFLAHKIIGFNSVWEGNLEAISDFFCGSGHVIPKHYKVGVFIQISVCVKRNL